MQAEKNNYYNTVRGINLWDLQHRASLNQQEIETYAYVLRDMQQHMMIAFSYLEDFASG